MHFNVAFELDSGLFLPAAKAEGTHSFNNGKLPPTPLLASVGSKTVPLMLSLVRDICLHYV